MPSMKTTIAAASVVLASSAVAQISSLSPEVQQIISALPQCGKVCVPNMFAQAAQFGCAENDYVCLCNHLNFRYGIRDCSNEACPSQTDAAQVISAGNVVCAAVLGPPATSAIESSRIASAAAASSTLSGFVPSSSNEPAVIRTTNESGATLTTTLAVGPAPVDATTVGPDTTGAANTNTAGLTATDGGAAGAITTVIPVVGQIITTGSDFTSTIGSATGTAEQTVVLIPTTDANGSASTVTSTPEATPMGVTTEIPVVGGIITTGSDFTSTIGSATGTALQTVVLYTTTGADGSASTYTSTPGESSTEGGAAAGGDMTTYTTTGSDYTSTITTAAETAVVSVSTGEVTSTGTDASGSATTSVHTTLHTTTSGAGAAATTTSKAGSAGRTTVSVGLVLLAGAMSLFYL